MHSGTLLKLMCLQHNASHQTFMHLACRILVKNRLCDARGALPNALSHKYASDSPVTLATSQRTADSPQSPLPSFWNHQLSVFSRSVCVRGTTS